MMGDGEGPGNGRVARPRRSTCGMPAIIGEVARLQHKRFEADLGHGGRLRPCRANAQSRHRGTRPPPAWNCPATRQARKPRYNPRAQPPPAVIDLRSLCPLELDTMVGSVRKTGRLVIADEAVQIGAAGAKIVAQVQEAAFDYLDAPITRVAAPFAPVPASPAREKLFVPGKDRSVSAVRKLPGRDAE